MTLRWGPAPYRRNNVDQIADAPGIGRYYIKRRRAVGGFFMIDLFINGMRHATGSIDDLKAKAESHAAETPPIRR